MGRLMRDKYRIGFIDVGGWDTHVNEGGGAGSAGHQSRPVWAAGCRRSRSPWAPSGTIPWSWCSRSSAARSAKTAIAAPTMVTAPCTGCSAARSTAGAFAANSNGWTRGTLFQDRDYPVLNDYRARARRDVPLDVGSVPHADGARVPGRDASGSATGLKLGLGRFPRWIGASADNAAVRRALTCHDRAYFEALHISHEGKRHG